MNGSILHRSLKVVIFVILVPLMILSLFASVLSPFTSWLITGESEEADYLGKIYDWYDNLLTGRE